MERYLKVVGNGGVNGQDEKMQKVEEVNVMGEEKLDRLVDKIAQVREENVRRDLLHSQSIQQLKDSIDGLLKAEAERDGKIPGLEVAVADMGSKLSETDGLKERVAELGTFCEKFPELCNQVSSLSEKVTKAEAEKQGKSIKNIVLEHETMDEVYACPECSAGLLKGISKRPELFKRLLECSGPECILAAREFLAPEPTEEKESTGGF